MFWFAESQSISWQVVSCGFLYFLGAITDQSQMWVMVRCSIILDRLKHFPTKHLMFK